MSNSNLPKFGLCLFPISIFWLCLFQNPSYYEFFICQQAEFFMSISKGLIPNSTLCLIPKVLLQCLVFEPSMSNSKGLPTPIRLYAVPPNRGGALSTLNLLFLESDDFLQGPFTAKCNGQKMKWDGILLRICPNFPFLV